jgi:hypothetical protein
LCPLRAQNKSRLCLGGGYGRWDKRSCWRKTSTPGKREAYGGVVNVGFDWRPKSNVSIFASAEATAMNDKSFSAAGKGGVRVGF